MKKINKINIIDIIFIILFIILFIKISKKYIEKFDVTISDGKLNLPNNWSIVTDSTNTYIKNGTTNILKLGPSNRVAVKGGEGASIIVDKWTISQDTTDNNLKFLYTNGTTTNVYKMAKEDGSDGTHNGSQTWINRS